MPAPQTQYCTDHYIYTFLETYVNPIICKYNIKPNYITFTNMILISIMFISFHYKINKYYLLGMMILYHIIDCLDGSVARQCKKQSFSGLILDHISDGLCLLMYLYIIYTSLKNHKTLYKYTSYYIVVAITIYLSFCLFCISEIFKINIDFIFNGKYENIQIFHDNGVLNHITMWVIIAYLN